MTNNEAFATIVNHLWNQKVPSFGFDQSCKYRGENGLKCAIGCLITDAEYKPEMEFKSIKTIIRNYNVPSLNGIDLDMLTDLQNVHDDIIGGECRFSDTTDGLNDRQTRLDFLENINAVASKFNITFDMESLHV